MFRRAKYFHKHKLSVCRAYHRPIAPTYEEVLAFQGERERDSSWNSQQPSTSSEQVYEYKECNRIIKFVENESGFVDPYEGIEELCGETRTNSPEPGELLGDPGSPASTSEGLSNSDDVEEGEYIEWLPTTDDTTPTKSSINLDHLI
ncbi:hypothetical protein KIN20_024730 [Parelaphostrongylus tenuis]|uniref:Uncharacterized protein n=1 Tax=Parelaphostrongylus tenuis TaxID=148309 RepID=A0AAD5NA76_PARTN|nr:hypothetical protein KIN20_024730 [Parelaphostrongylus tenuis]